MNHEQLADKYRVLRDHVHSLLDAAEPYSSALELPLHGPLCGEEWYAKACALIGYPDKYHPDRQQS